MTNRDQIIEVMARSIRDGGDIACGFMADGELVFCNDPRVSNMHRQKRCECKLGAAAAFDALTAAGYWIAPNEPTEGMLNAAAECSWIVTGTPYKRATLEIIAIAIREAFLREKECRDNG